MADGIFFFFFYYLGHIEQGSSRRCLQRLRSPAETNSVVVMCETGDVILFSPPGANRCGCGVSARSVALTVQ